MKVLIFNAPPQSGKDYATEYVLPLLNGKHFSFKRPLHEMTARFLGMGVEEYIRDYEIHKKNLRITLNGVDRSLREFYIYLSEEVIKPTFGSNFFGREASNRLVDGWNVASDGGFPEEVDELLCVDELVICKIIKEGCNFSNDSRNWLSVNKATSHYTIHNDGTKNFHCVLDDLVRKILAR